MSGRGRLLNRPSTWDSVFAGTAEKSIASISKSAKLFFAGLTAALLMRLPSQLDRQCRRRLRAGPARCGAYPWQVATREFREGPPRAYARGAGRSEEHTSELQSLMRISYSVFCLKKKQKTKN